MAVELKDLQEFQSEEDRAKTSKTPWKRNAGSTKNPLFTNKGYRKKCHDGTATFKDLAPEDVLKLLISIIFELDSGVENLQNSTLDQLGM